MQELENNDSEATHPVPLSQTMIFLPWESIAICSTSGNVWKIFTFFLINASVQWHCTSCRAHSPPKTTSDSRIFKKCPPKKKEKKLFHTLSTILAIDITFVMGPSPSPWAAHQFILECPYKFLNLNPRQIFHVGVSNCCCYSAWSLQNTCPHTVCISRLVLHHCLVPSFTKRPSAALSSLAQVWLSWSSLQSRRETSTWGRNFTNTLVRLFLWLLS